MLSSRTAVRAFAAVTSRRPAVFRPGSAAPPAFVGRRTPTTAVRAVSTRGGGGDGDAVASSFPTWTFDGPCRSMEWSPGADFSTSVVPKLGADDAASASLLVVGLYGPAEGADGADGLSGAAADVDAETGGALAALLAESVKEFKNGSVAGAATPVLRTFVGGVSRRIVAVGLGPAGTTDGASTVSGKVGSALAKLVREENGVTSVAVELPDGAHDAPRLVTELHKGLYVDNRYRTGKNVVEVAVGLKSVVLGIPGADAAAVGTGTALAAGVALCMDVVNAPPNVLNPASMAETARRIADMSGGTMQCKVLNVADCEQRGMGAYLGVGRGAEVPPHFIHLTYTPPGDIKRKVAIVGKGLTFDTGGYNIKVAAMELMKFDCGGSAAVLGAARTVAATHPPGAEVHFVIAAAENSIGDRAYRPSDVLIASNGKTIEIGNTDAEGRLTLADALVYADREIGAASIVEMSTLTGAVMVSLGQGMSGLWTADDALAQELVASAATTGEQTWRMPLPEEYEEQIKSKIADLKNVGGRYGGAITAALFLNHFVEAKKPFAHVDIAGPVWNDGAGVATGYGVRLLVDWIGKQGKD